MKRFFLLSIMSLFVATSCSSSDDDATIAVTGVTTSKVTLSLAVGQTHTLFATVTPVNATTRVATWKSLDETIAVVSADGIVTAIASGTASIVATVGDKSSTCQVTVVDSRIPATSVILSELKHDVFIPESGVIPNFSLTASVLPSNTTDQIWWTSSRPSVAKVDQNGNVTVLTTGFTDIIATAGGVTSNCVITVTRWVLYIPIVELIPSTLEVTLDARPADAADTDVIEGTSAPITVTYLPANATDSGNIMWLLGDATMAQVHGSLSGGYTIYAGKTPGDVVVQVIVSVMAPDEISVWKDVTVHVLPAPVLPVFAKIGLK